MVAGCSSKVLWKFHDIRRWTGLIIPWPTPQRSATSSLLFLSFWNFCSDTFSIVSNLAVLMRDYFLQYVSPGLVFARRSISHLTC